MVALCDSPKRPITTEGNRKRKTDGKAGDVMEIHSVGFRTDRHYYGVNEKAEFEKDYKKFLCSPRHDVEVIYKNENGYCLEVKKARTIY